MCTMIARKISLDGSGRRSSGWFSAGQASVSYDHPFHIRQEHARNLDRVNEDLRLNARVAEALTERGCSSPGSDDTGSP